MADTFHVTVPLSPIADTTQLPPNPTLFGEASVATAALLPTLGGNPGGPCVVSAAPFAIFNSEGSGKLVNILEIDLRETQGRTTTASLFSFGFGRCSAMSGGDDIEVTKFDSDSDDLPAEVLVREVIGAYTSAGGTIRKVLDTPQLNFTRAVPFPPWRTPTSWNNDRVYGASNADVQGQVLREGQGFVAMTTAGTGKEPFPVAVVVIFSVGSATYMARTRGSADTFPAFLGIFNGSGSGVVVTINQILVAEVLTDDTPLRRYQLETISGINAPDRLDVVSLDSAVTLPSGIVVAQKAACFQASADCVVAPSRPNEHVLRRLVRADAGASPGLATPFTNPPKCGGQVFTQRSDGALVLRPGEGIALYQRQTYSGLAFGYQLSVLFSVEDAPGQAIAPVIGSTIVRAA